MLSRLFLLFALVPFLELYLLVQVGTVIGAAPTILLVILTAVVGAWLARTQGLGVMARVQNDLARGIMPGQALIDGFCILLAGLLLLTPGFLTDVVGLLLLLPPFRALLASRLQRHFAVRYASSGTTAEGGHFIVYGSSGPAAHEEPRHAVVIDTQPIDSSPAATGLADDTKPLGDAKPSGDGRPRS
ncbi:MAG TPA: exlusion protein FxsA [Desulfovibrio sp.]|nr:exlusion protein FxsA [Desulfovibrio sp.]